MLDFVLRNQPLSSAAPEGGILTSLWYRRPQMWIALGVFLMALWVMGLWDTTGDVANPEADKVGAFLEKQRQPQRVRRQQRKELDF